MRLFIFTLALFGMSWAVAAVAPAPTPAADEVVLDVDTMEQDLEEFALTQEDEEFLNSEDTPSNASNSLPQGQQEAKVDVKTAPAPKK